MTISVRATGPNEHEAVLAVVRAAFGGDAIEEVRICRQVWASNHQIPDLDLVALDGLQIVGHVLGSRGDLDGTGVVAVAPLAVERAHQRQGVGSTLMRELLARADQAGWPIAVLIGDPGYYRRFGFGPARPLGITFGPDADPAAPYQAMKFGSYDPALRGRFRYLWELFEA